MLHGAKMVESLLKICSKCLKEKPIDEFHKDSTHNDGLKTQCKECRNPSGKIPKVFLECQVLNCLSDLHYRGFCRFHYDLNLKGFTVDQMKLMKFQRKLPCLIKNCENPHFGRNYCRWHYDRWYRYGDPLYEPFEFKYLTTDGYVMLSQKHPENLTDKPILEHRAIFMKILDKN